MKCQNCYCEIKETDSYCKNCGQELKGKGETVVKFNNPNFKRRNSHPWLIVGVVIFIMLAAFIGTIIYIIKYDEEHPIETYKDTTSEQIDKREKKQTTQVDFNGFTFTIPADNVASVTDNKLFIYGKNNEWILNLAIQEGKYENMLNAKDQIITILSNQSESESYDLSEAITEEKEYGGKNFILTKNIKSLGYYVDISYGKADENNIYVIAITKSDGTEIDEIDRNKVYPIIASANKGV